MRFKICGPDELFESQPSVARDKWLYSTFPRFSSKSRGNKGLEITPPPHTLHNRGRCDIQIGPHIFPSTVVFEVHYQYIPPIVNASQYVYQPPVPNHSAPWQTTTPYGKNPNISQGKTLGTDQAVQASNPIAASVEAVVSQKTSSPLLSSLGAEVPITPGLVTQVNIAAASNPTLANLLQMAASGQATPDQLKTLALLIQSLACISSNDELPELPRTISKTGSETSQPDDACNSSTAAPVYNTPRAPFKYPIYRPSKEFDIVFEFSENSSDRWILPRSPAIIDNDNKANNSDILLTVGVPFEIPPSQVAQLASSGTDTTQHLVNFRFCRVSDDIKSCLSRWNGGQQSIEVTRKALNAIVSEIYGIWLNNEHFIAQQCLQQMLSRSSTSTRPAAYTTSKRASSISYLFLYLYILQAALPPYTLKSIRPVEGDPAKPKRVRKPAVRKTAVISADAPVLSLQIQPAIPAVIAPFENAALTQPSEQSQTVAGPSSQAQISQTPAPKQRRQSKAQSTLSKMACDSCGQTNIPLVKGGSECFPIFKGIVADFNRAL